MTTPRELPRGRVDAALRRRANWEQLVKFCVVGATGYVVNLVVYTLLLELSKRGKRFGIASACIGGGQGIAAIVEVV